MLRAGKPDPSFSSHLLVWRWLRRWCACGRRWKACQLRRNQRVLTTIARIRAGRFANPGDARWCWSRRTDTGRPGRPADVEPSGSRRGRARERRDNRPAWDVLTVANPVVGRAGLLTPAQRWRANGGRW